MPKVAEVAERAERADWLPGDSGDLIAIDPGDVHVGWAEFRHDQGKWSCVNAHEDYTPAQAADRLAVLIGRGDVRYVVLERFQLYADKAMAQVGSEMATAEMIGVVKALVRWNNEDASVRSPWANGEVELLVQGAAIKKATRAQMKARQIPRLTNVGTHAGDAEEHGWCAIMRGTT